MIFLLSDVYKIIGLNFTSNIIVSIPYDPIQNNMFVRGLKHQLAGVRILGLRTNSLGILPSSSISKGFAHQSAALPALTKVYIIGQKS